MIKAFNETIRYIESVLEDEIDEKKIATISSYSYAMFSRLFSILTDMTLSEYIRYRRLTKSAENIMNSNEKIIDIAMKYGYESSDSFTNAFKSFHNVTPSQVRKGEPYRVVSPIQLSLKITGGKDMDVKISKKDGFFVAGVKKENIDSSLCPSVWGELFSKYTHEELSLLGNGQNYGMCYDVQDENKINYMACYDVNDIEKARQIGLEVIEIKEAQYSVLSLEGKVPECIHQGWKYAMENFLPENSYMHSGQPDFEVYFEGDMDSPNYKMELWIPIVKK